MKSFEFVIEIAYYYVLRYDGLCFFIEKKNLEILRYLQQLLVDLVIII